MDDFIEILIFAIIIIANIAGVIKKKQKKKAAELDLPVPTADEDFFEYDDPDTSEEKHNTLLAAPPSNFPQTTDSNAPCPACPAEKSDNFCNSRSIEVTDFDDNEEESFDYGDFLQSHGRKAFVLAEIILPANSRQGK